MVGFAAGFFFYGLFYLLLTYLISASIKSQPEMYIALNYSQVRRCVLKVAHLLFNVDSAACTAARFARFGGELDLSVE